MAHDVFISHSSRDKPVADAVCAALENGGIRCWIAPRDVQPGRPFAGEITRAIGQSKAMVLIFSANSNNSSQILREVQLAVDAQLHILQFRIEEVLLNDDLRYYLSTPHWLDAMTPPLENHLGRLAASLKLLLEKSETRGAAAADVVSAPVERDPIPLALRRAPRRNLWLLLMAAIVLLGAIIAAVLLYRKNEAPNSVSHASDRSNTPPASSPVSKGPRLFVDNFETAAQSMTPVFGPRVMSARNANGEAEVTGKAPGVLPAIFDKFTAADFILECDVRAPAVPVGASYGFIFRAAAVANGGIARYYALLFDPNQTTVVLNLWLDTRWVTGPAGRLPAGLVDPGRMSRFTLEAMGNRFRIFIDGQLVFEPTFAEPFALKEGRIGFCLTGADSQPWTVYFDNLEVSLPPGKRDAMVTSSPAAPSGKPFQQTWDFSAGMLTDIRTDAVELVDAKIWKMAGGKHLRFLTGGRSFLEASFDVPENARPPTELVVRHLSSSPDGKLPGFSPVRITLNGAEVFRGSPAQTGWMDNQYDLADHAKVRRNTLRWDLLDGAQTHYWLKSFSLGSGANR